MGTDKDIILKMSLQAWYSLKRKTVKSNTEKNLHLPEKSLYMLALSGAIREADPKALAHLALCPLCLNRWAQFRRSISDIQDSVGYEEKKVVAWGMLEAAASKKLAEPLRLKSSCGQFFLGIFPQRGNIERGMITLEVESNAGLSQLEGHKATVKDHTGRILLEGKICQGRLARKIEKISDVNLTCWTVTVDE